MSAPARPGPGRWRIVIRWARELGWLAIRDPYTGDWHEIEAKDAPRHWRQIAQAEKKGDEAVRRLPPGIQRAVWERRRCAPCATFKCAVGRCTCGCHQPQRCRSCNALIWWGTTARGTRCPYDYDVEQHATNVPHFASCPQKRQWTS